MSGITIIPGTFNPPATPAQAMRLYTFPKAPDVTLRKPTLSYQWATRPSQSDGSVSAPCDYSRFSYVSGGITVGVVADPFNSGIAYFRPQGVRYVPVSIYEKTSSDPTEKEYSGTGEIILTPGTGIDVGTVDIYSGTKGYNHIKVQFAYSVTLAGVSDGATYLFNVAADDSPTATSGTFLLGVAWPGANEGTNGETRPLAGYYSFSLRLRRDGDDFDLVYFVIPIVGTVRFLDAASTTQPVVSSGLTVIDTLYGAGSSPTTVTPPSLPISGYARESFATQGRVVLS